jgi:hypothetical protein
MLHYFDLAEFVAKITSKNRHSEIESGPSMGAEFSGDGSAFRGHKLGIKSPTKVELQRNLSEIVIEITAG